MIDEQRNMKLKDILVHIITYFKEFSGQIKKGNVCRFDQTVPTAQY